MEIWERIVEQREAFAMMFSGLVFFFAIRWSYGYREGKWAEPNYWRKQRLEAIVSAIGGIIFCFWPTEIIGLWNYVVSIFVELRTDEPAEFVDYFYFLVAPAIDIGYRKIVNKIS